MGLSKRLVLKYVRTKFKLLSSISKRKAAEKAFELFCTPQYRVSKDLPPVFKKSEKIEFTFEGNTIRGYRWNHPSTKKALILHGFESSVINFEKYIEPQLSKQIRWVGEVNESQRNYLFTHALCSLHPVNWPEPFGLTLIEAMACGTPVIAFNKGAIPEVIKNGISQYDQGDQRRYPECVGRLLER